MQLSNGEKKAAAIAATVLVAFVAVVGVSVYLLVRNTDRDHRPYFDLAVGGRLDRVEPVRWCDVYLKSCEPALGADQLPTPRHPVKIDDSVLLTVSSDIAETPWTLAAVYSTPRGVQEDERTNASGSTYSVVLHSKPERVLIGITVSPASVVQVGQGTVFPRGVLTADTRPEGYTVPIG